MKNYKSAIAQRGRSPYRKLSDLYPKSGNILSLSFCGDIVETIEVSQSQLSTVQYICFNIILFWRVPMKLKTIGTIVLGVVAATVFPSVVQANNNSFSGTIERVREDSFR